MLKLFRLFAFMSLILSQTAFSSVSVFETSALKDYFKVSDYKLLAGINSGFLDTKSDVYDNRGFNYGFHGVLELNSKRIDHNFSLGFQSFNNSNTLDGDYDTNAFIIEYSPLFNVLGMFKAGPIASLYTGDDVGFSESQNRQRSAVFWGAKVSKDFGLRGSELDFRVALKGLRDLNIDNKAAYIGLLELQVSLPFRSKRSNLVKNINTQYFEVNKMDIDPTTKVELKKLSQNLKEKPDTWKKVIIYGHADSRGTDSFNDILSLQRANSLRTELLKNGVTASKIIVVAKGKREPAAIGNSEDDFMLNRRVQIEVEK